MATRAAGAVLYAKNACIKFPDLVCSLAVGVVGTIGCGFHLYNYEKFKEHQFKKKYTVIRPEDFRHDLEKKYAN